MTWFQRTWAWSLQRRWRTWMFHSLFAVVAAALLSLPFPGRGGLVAIIAFLAIEIRQATDELAAGVSPHLIDWTDHWWDWFAPALVCAALNIAFGW